MLGWLAGLAMTLDCLNGNLMKPTRRDLPPNCTINCMSAPPSFPVKAQTAEAFSSPPIPRKIPQSMSTRIQNLSSSMDILRDGGFCPSTGIYRSLWDSPSLPTNPSLSLPDFLLSTLPLPSKPAFIDAVSGAALTYSDLRALTASAARSLSKLGVTKGDVVLVVTPNFLHFPVLVLAIMSLGAVFSTANFLHTRAELEVQVRDSNPTLILATEELRPKLDGLVPRPAVLIEPLMAGLSKAESAPVPAGQRDTAALMYSSGTTGKSKAVVCTHRSLVTMSLLLRHAWAGAAREEVYLCAVPLFHMFGFSVFVCGAVAAVATVVVMRRYAVEEVLMAVEEHRVTRLPAVPPMVIQLARSSEVAKGYDLSSLKEVICSGAPLGREHMERFTESYPGITLSQCYGLTETCGPVTLCDGIKGRFHLSIGRLIPCLEAKISDVRTGKSLPPNKYGELCLRGPSIMQGYLNNQEATHIAIDKEGWLHTGDLCYIDMRGLVYVVDRIKELIKYKAYQVAPAELEEILFTHPDVHDVAVIPHPDEEAGEIPMACIVRKSGRKLKEDDIITFMEKKVAPYKKIRKVLFVEFIPRSPSGKILRRLIKANSLQHEKLEITARL